MEQLEQAQRELADLQKSIKNWQERLDLVDRLLALEGTQTTTESPPRPSPDQLLSACEDLIRTAGHPLHISELHRALLANGMPIPGKGAEANLIVRLQRAGGRFVRTGRGTYGIPELGIAEVRPVRHVRRPRRGS